MLVLYIPYMPSCTPQVQEIKKIDGFLQGIVYSQLDSQGQASKVGSSSQAALSSGDGL